MKKSYMTFILATAIGISLAGNAGATRSARVGARAGYPSVSGVARMSDAYGCFQDSPLDIASGVVQAVACYPTSGTGGNWNFAIPVETTGLTRALNAYIDVYAPAGTPISTISLRTYSYNGIFQYQDFKFNVASGSYTLTASVLAGGYGVISTSLNTAGQAVRSYAWEYNF